MLSIGEFAKLLDVHYPEEITFLSERDPFRFLISVVLSAQTTDAAVQKVTRVLFERYPTRKALAEAPLEDVEAVIRPLGCFRSKAVHITAIARNLQDREIPSTITELIRLPGVGRKSANCYIGSILGEGAIIVDTHFKRVVNRLQIVESDNPDKIERILKRKLPEEDQYRFSMTVNLHGREVCHAKKPDCEHCFLKDECPSEVVFYRANARQSDNLSAQYPPRQL